MFIDNTEFIKNNKWIAESPNSDFSVRLLKVIHDTCGFDISLPSIPDHPHLIIHTPNDDQGLGSTIAIDANVYGKHAYLGRGFGLLKTKEVIEIKVQTYAQYRERSKAIREAKIINENIKRLNNELARLTSIINSEADDN